jgi:acetolactate synthase-1/2/3 large subunit
MSRGPHTPPTDTRGPRENPEFVSLPQTGATNLVTGLATAYMDSVPMVAITGQVKTHLIGNDAFQEADITGITRPVTKHNFLVKDVNELAVTIKEAFHIASTGRPGPVVIESAR